MEERDTTFNKVLEKLSGIDIVVTEHEAVRTSEEAAAIRGTTLASGAKAMLLSSSNLFLLAVMAANRKLDWKKMKTLLKSKSVRFATEEEVHNITECIPGAVPPFGSVFNIQTYTDISLREQGESINFNAGMRTRSVSMKYADYEQVESPIMGDFTKE